MGEIIPIAIGITVVLVVIVLALIKVQYSRRVVVKPLDEEELVNRVRVKISAEQAHVLAQKLDAAAAGVESGGAEALVDYNDEPSNRIIRFNIGKRAALKGNA